MRSLLLLFAACVAFIAAITFEPPNANAAACARGAYRGGCVGPRGGFYRGPVYRGGVYHRPLYRGGVVVGRPVAACRWVWVNGVKVRRCV